MGSFGFAEWVADRFPQSGCVRRNRSGSLVDASQWRGAAKDLLGFGRRLCIRIPNLVTRWTLDRLREIPSRPRHHGSMDRTLERRTRQQKHPLVPTAIRLGSAMAPGRATRL